MRIHYNYCREHSALGKTPAEAAGIKMEDSGSNRIKSLIRSAAKNKGADELIRFSNEPRSN